MDEPLTPFDDGAGKPEPADEEHHMPPPPLPPLPHADASAADSIPHKKSFLELMRRK